MISLLWLSMWFFVSARLNFLFPYFYHTWERCDNLTTYSIQNASEWKQPKESKQINQRKIMIHDTHSPLLKPCFLTQIYLLKVYQPDFLPLLPANLFPSSQPRIPWLPTHAVTQAGALGQRCPNSQVILVFHCLHWANLTINSSFQKLHL